MFVSISASVVVYVLLNGLVLLTKGLKNGNYRIYTCIIKQTSVFNKSGVIKSSRLPRSRHIVPSERIREYTINKILKIY